MRLCSALSEMSAGEGFGVVLGAALNGLIALALIFAVLIIMNKLRKNDGSDEAAGEAAEETEEAPEGKEDGDK